MPPRTRKPIEFPPIPAKATPPAPVIPELCPHCFAPDELPPDVRSAGCQHGRWYFDADGAPTAFEP